MTGYENLVVIARLFGHDRRGAWPTPGWTGRTPRPG